MGFSGAWNRLPIRAGVVFENSPSRDYPGLLPDIAGADLSTAAVVLGQIPGWIADYNAVAPHSALGYRSPQRYRSSRPTAGVTC